MLNFIYAKIQSLFKHNFVRDTATLQVGTLFSTGLTFIASIVFARALGPEDYGKYGLIFAFTALIGIFLNWGADHATLTLMSGAWANKDKQKIKELIIYFLKLSLYVNGTIGLLAFFAAPLIANNLYHDFGIGSLARWVLLSNILNVLFSLLIIILQVVRKIKHLAVLENINKIFYIALPIFLVLIGWHLKGIVFGYLIGGVLFFVFSFFFYLIMIKKTDLLPSFQEISDDFFNVPIKKYFRFGFLIAIDKNLANLYSILPMTFLGMFALKTDIGYFKIAFSYIGLSFIFLKPISRLLSVQLPKSNVLGFDVLKKHFFKTAFYSFLIILGLMAPMLFLAKFLVLTFYGEKFLPSVNLIYWLWPYALASSVGIGLGALYRTLNKMKITILTNLIIFILTSPIIYWLIKNFNLKGMLISVTLWTVIPIISLISYFYFYSKKISNGQTNHLN